CPRPLEAVMARHGLGRFRILQKADPHDPGDVYRPENARPEDWVMPGTHDTPPLWRVVGDWQGDERGEAHAAWLTRLLCPAPEEQEAFAAALRADPSAMVHALVASLLASPAQRV